VCECENACGMIFPTRLPCIRREEATYYARKKLPEQFFDVFSYGNVSIYDETFYPAIP